MTTEPEQPAPGAGLRQPRLARRPATASGVGVGMYAELPGSPQAAREAREIVSRTLGDHPYAHDAVLIISELVSNAIRHSRSGQPGGTVTIAVETTPWPGDLNIQVRDAGGPQTPILTAADPDAFVFARPDGRPLAYANWRRTVWGPSCARAGIPACQFHDLRRTNATALVAEGVDVKTAQARLGHSDVRLTLDVYAQVVSSADRSAADVVGARFAPSVDKRRRPRTSG